MQSSQWGPPLLETLDRPVAGLLIRLSKASNLFDGFMEKHCVCKRSSGTKQPATLWMDKIPDLLGGMKRHEYLDETTYQLVWDSVHPRFCTFSRVRFVRLRLLAADLESTGRHEENHRQQQAQNCRLEGAREAVE